MASFTEVHAKLVKQFGAKTIDKARPYYEAFVSARRAQMDVRHVAEVFERVSMEWNSAKDRVSVAEALLALPAKNVQESTQVFEALIQSISSPLLSFISPS